MDCSLVFLSTVAPAIPMTDLVITWCHFRCLHCTKSKWKSLQYRLWIEYQCFSRKKKKSVKFLIRNMSFAEAARTLLPSRRSDGSHLPGYRILWAFVFLKAVKPWCHLELEKQEGSCFPVCGGSFRTAFQLQALHSSRGL